MLVPSRALVVLGLALVCLGIECRQASTMAPQGLLDALVAALNTKQESALRAFVEQHATGGVPVEQRLGRLSRLFEGAPFTVVRLGPAGPGRVSAVVTDGHGEALGFTMEIEGTDEPKMAGLQVGSPDDLDTPAPRDYTGWRDPASLAAAVRADTQSPALALAVLREGKLEQAVSGVRVMGGTDAVLPDDPWSLGSIGKPVCATLIGRLIELGKLRWDTTLGEALAGLPMKAGYRGVTVEQLMHHRGGVPEDLDFNEGRVARLVGGATDPVQMRGNYARDILSRDPIAAPGERFAYSNAGYALLGVVAERAMHKPYETLLRELVFAPLGLKHSYTGKDRLPARRPSGHMTGPQGLRPQNMAGPLETLLAPAGGGLYMSVGDLARFGEAHLRGLRGENALLQASTVQRLHQGLPEEPGGVRQYACGWGIESFPGIETMHTHNGSNGTFRAQVAVFPKANLVVAAFVNRGGESEPSPPLQSVLAVAKRYAPSAEGGPPSPPEAGDRREPQT